MFAFGPTLNAGLITGVDANRQDFAERGGKIPPECRFFGYVAFLRQVENSRPARLGLVCNEGQVRLGFGNLSEKHGFPRKFAA